MSEDPTPYGYDEAYIIHITHYDEINGQRSARRPLNKTVNSMDELEQLRKELKQQTGHDIAFVYKQKSDNHA